MNLANEPVGDVATSSFRRSNNLHDLSALQAEIACDRITGLDAHQHVLFQLVTGQQLTFFLRRHHDVLRYQFVFGDVDEKFRFEELFDDVFRSHFNQHLFCRWTHGALNDHDGSVDVFLLHSGAVSADEFDADFGLVGEENEHLVGRVVVVVDKNN